MSFINLGKISNLGQKFPKTVLLTALILAVVCTFFGRKLKIETDFSSLLPPETQSVQNFLQLKEYYGSMGYLYLLVQGAPETVGKFSERFVGQIEMLPEVRYVDYKKPVDYFLQRKWLYVDMLDLIEMERRIDHSLQLDDKKLSPVFNSLMDFADEEDRPYDLTFDDIKEKYEKRLGAAPEEESKKEKQSFQIIKVKSKLGAQDYKSNRALTKKIQAIDHALSKDTEFSGINVGYAGSYVSSVETVDRIQQEMNWVSIAVILTLLFLLSLYFRKLSSALIIGLPLVMGILWTIGFAYFIFGRVNIITSFAVPILAGLGSDYGIYLFSRFSQEVRNGKSFIAACTLAFENTGNATFSAMLTTVIAFTALAISGFEVFVEFGIVGGVGLLFNFIAMMLLMPSILKISEQHQKNRFLQFFIGWSHLSKLPPQSFPPLGQKVIRAGPPALALSAFAFLVFASLLIFPKQSKIHLEPGQLDFRGLPSEQVYSSIMGKEGNVLDPTIFLVAGAENERKLVRELDQNLAKDTEQKLVFNKILGLSSFIPEQVGEKQQLLERIQGKYNQLKYINPSQKEQFVTSITETLNSPPVSAKTLPEEVTRNFISPKSEEMFAIYVYPSVHRSGSDDMGPYMAGIQGQKENTSVSFIPIDGSFISADILSLISKEAKRGFFLILIFLPIILFWQMRIKGSALLILIHLLGALALTFGALYLLGIRLNVLNIAVFPIIIGTGIDSFIHFYHRFQEEGDLNLAIRNEVPAILVSNLTTMVGFGGLIFTSNPGLQSVGWVCVCGLVMVSLTCVLIFPRTMILLQKQKYLRGFFRSLIPDSNS